MGGGGGKVHDLPYRDQEWTQIQTVGVGWKDRNNMHRHKASQGEKLGKRSRFDALLLVAEEQALEDEDQGPASVSKEGPKSSHRNHGDTRQTGTVLDAKETVGKRRNEREQNDVLPESTISQEEILRKQNIVAIEKRLGSIHPEVGKAILDLGVYYSSVGDAVHAQRCFLRSWNIFTQYLPQVKAHESGPIVPFSNVPCDHHGPADCSMMMPKRDMTPWYQSQSPCCVELSSSDLVNTVSHLVI